MTDTFLDDQQVANLRRDLDTIRAQSSELLRIARRETSPPGGRAARNPQVPGSRPPVNIGALSVSNELHVCLTGWMRCLLDDALVEFPDDLNDRSVALHLRVHAHRIAQQSWAADCAEEVEHWARVVRSITIPPPEKTLADYTPAQRAEGWAVAKVSAQMCADLVAEHTNGALSPTAEQIIGMARRERIGTYGPRGNRAYSPREVVAYMRHIRSRRILDKMRS